MQLRQIEVFHAVMISGSTTAAAERLAVTQPAISTTLARMQDELGFRLFIRRGGRLVPTPEADFLFRQIRALKEDVDQLERTAARLARGQLGQVRLGVVPALGEGVSARAIRHMRRDAPDVTISLDVLNTHDLLHRLRTGRLDLIAIFGSGAEFPVETVYAARCGISAVVPKGWGEPTRPMSDAEIANHPLALMRPTDPIGEAISSRFAESHSAVEVRTSFAAIAMAEAGVSIGIADAITLSERSLSQSTEVSFDPPLAIDISIVRDANRVRSGAEQKLATSLTYELQKFLG